MGSTPPLRGISAEAHRWVPCSLIQEIVDESNNLKSFETFEEYVNHRPWSIAGAPIPVLDPYELDSSSYWVDDFSSTPETNRDHVANGEDQNGAPARKTFTGLDTSTAVAEYHSSHQPSWHSSASDTQSDKPDTTFSYIALPKRGSGWRRCFKAKVWNRVNRIVAMDPKDIPLKTKTPFFWTLFFSLPPALTPTLTHILHRVI